MDNRNPFTMEVVLPDIPPAEHGNHLLVILSTLPEDALGRLKGLLDDGLNGVPDEVRTLSPYLSLPNWYRVLQLNAYPRAGILTSTSR